jgi:biotin transport system substrate-specific component
MTAQLVPVLLAGALLGARGGALSQILLIAVGLAGAPVFTGGAFGPAHLLGPTGGYLIGFAGAAWLVGRLLHGRERFRYPRILASMIAGASLVHLFGMLQLMVFMGGSASLAFELGSLPFLIGDLLKAVLAASIVAAWSIRRQE